MDARLFEYNLNETHAGIAAAMTVDGTAAATATAAAAVGLTDPLRALVLLLRLPLHLLMWIAHSGVDRPSLNGSGSAVGGVREWRCAR